MSFDIPRNHVPRTTTFRETTAVQMLSRDVTSCFNLKLRQFKVDSGGGGSKFAGKLGPFRRHLVI